MTFPVEIVLKGSDSLVTESLLVPTEEVPAWDETLVRAVLVELLRAIGRAQDREAPADRPVVLQGFSWIVEPLNGQVIIAIEIPMGAAVAGPFNVEHGRLDELVARVIRADRQMQSPETIH